MKPHDTVGNRSKLGIAVPKFGYCEEVDIDWDPQKVTFFQFTGPLPHSNSEVHFCYRSRLRNSFHGLGGWHWHRFHQCLQAILLRRRQFVIFGFVYDVYSRTNYWSFCKVNCTPDGIDCGFGGQLSMHAAFAWYVTILSPFHFYANFVTFSNSESHKWH